MPRAHDATRFDATVRAALKKGGIGVLPTDTIYGIVGSALKPATVKRIYAVKGRDEGKPLIVLLSSFADLSKFGIRLPPRERSDVNAVLRAAKRPTTVILPVPWKRSAYLHRGTERFRFRIPNIPALRSLLRDVGPLVAPSANPQGEAPAMTIREARQYFKDRVDFYVDGGRKNGKPSRLIELHSNGTIEVIRK